MSPDSAYVLDCFKDDIRKRPGVSEELVQAFDELMETMKQAPSGNAKSETGCLGSLNRDFSIGVSLTQDVDSGSDSDGNYEDVAEEWEPMAREIHEILRT